MPITHVGDLTDDLLYGALSPDGGTLYAFELNRGFDLREYTYPALSGGSIIVNNILGPVACDDAGEVYWTNFHVVGSTAATQILKDPSSPTVVWTSSYGPVNPTVSMCWSPYDSMLYALVGDVLYRIHPTTGVATLAYTPSVGGGTQTEGPVPTLDGGIWWSTDAANRINRYDIPSNTGADTGVSTTSYQDQVLPRPDHNVWGVKSAGSSGWVIEPDFTTTIDMSFAGLTGGFRGVAYTPDLSLVVFGNRGTNEVWQIGDLPVVTAHWRVGRIGWPT